MLNYVDFINYSAPHLSNVVRNDAIVANSYGVVGSELHMRLSQGVDSRYVRQEFKTLGGQCRIGIRGEVSIESESDEYVTFLVIDELNSSGAFVRSPKELTVKSNSGYKFFELNLEKNPVPSIAILLGVFSSRMTGAASPEYKIKFRNMSVEMPEVIAPGAFDYIQNIDKIHLVNGLKSTMVRPLTGMAPIIAGGIVPPENGTITTEYYSGASGIHCNQTMILQDNKGVYTRTISPAQSSSPPKFQPVMIMAEGKENSTVTSTGAKFSAFNSGTGGSYGTKLSDDNSSNFNYIEKANAAGVVQAGLYVRADGVYVVMTSGGPMKKVAVVP